MDFTAVSISAAVKTSHVISIFSTTGGSAAESVVVSADVSASLLKY